MKFSILSIFALFMSMNCLSMEEALRKKHQEKEETANSSVNILKTTLENRTKLQQLTERISQKSVNPIEQYNLVKIAEDISGRLDEATLAYQYANAVLWKNDPHHLAVAATHIFYAKRFCATANELLKKYEHTISVLKPLEQEKTTQAKL